MRQLFLFSLALLSCLPFSWAQFIEPTEKAIKENKVREYKITGLSHEKVKSNFNGRLLKQVLFNQNGKISQHYELTMEAVYSVDSASYKYDDKGNLIEISKIHKDVTEEKEEDTTYLKEIEYSRVTQTIRNSYTNNKHTKLEFFTEDNLETTSNYFYDGKGRIIKEQENNDLAFYVYNAAGQLIQIKRYYPEERKDTLISTYTYDAAGNLSEEHLKESYRTVVSNYKYNDKNQLLEKNSKIESVLGNSAIRFLYSYDEKGNCIERKTSEKGILKEWEQYRYNDKNLPIEEVWVNLKTGEKKTSFIWEYTFF